MCFKGEVETPLAIYHAEHEFGSLNYPFIFCLPNKYENLNLIKNSSVGLLLAGKSGTFSILNLLFSIYLYIIDI